MEELNNNCKDSCIESCYTTKIQSTTKNKSVLSKFVQLIKNPFLPSEEKNLSSLEGRVAEENEATRAAQLFEQLLSVQEKVYEGVDAELSFSVEEAMKKIMRDFRRLQKNSCLSASNESNNWKEWMAKAKRWVELDVKLHDRTAVIDAIMTQSFSHADELIDQDVRLIFDYISHSLEVLPLSTEQKEVLQKEIYKAIESQIEALLKLKEKPRDLKFDGIEEWKEHLGDQRGICFDKTLQIIDSVIGL